MTLASRMPFSLALSPSSAKMMHATHHGQIAHISPVGSYKEDKAFLYLILKSLLSQHSFIVTQYNINNSEFITYIYNTMQQRQVKKK